MILAFLLRRGRNDLLGGALVLLLAGALVAWLGVGPALDRFSTYRKLEVTESRRIEMVQDSWKIFFAHPVLGTGLGTLQEVFPRYATLYDGLVVNHTHNDYVEALAETGLIGGIFGLAFLAALFRGAWIRFARAKNPMDLAFHVGSFSACCGLLVHSLVDFNLHIPSNALLFLLQGVLATSPTPSSRSRPLAPSKAAISAEKRLSAMQQSAGND
jgi:O-antigen ligase